MGLVDKVNLMKKSYFKGFGGLVCGIFYNCSHYYDHEKPENIKNLVFAFLDKIESHYQNLPFEQYESDSDFAPLFVVHELLQDYGKLVRDFFENPSEDKLKHISHRRTTICDVGEIYRRKFKNRLNELRKIPGHEKYIVEFIDHKGDRFLI